MNELEFYKNQVSIWGVDYVEDLVERGYAPKLTEHGYRWLYTPNPVDFINRGTHGKPLDSEPSVCYSGRVGGS